MSRHAGCIGLSDLCTVCRPALQTEFLPTNMARRATRGVALLLSCAMIIDHTRFISPAKWSKVFL